MHIVYVCREYIPTKRGGGIASYIKEIAEGLSERGHQITVICASDDTRSNSDTIENGIRVIRLSGGDFFLPMVECGSSLKKFRVLYRFYSYRNKIRKVIDELENVDIIEVPEFGAEAFCLRNYHIPVVIRLHTPTLLDRNNAGIKSFELKTFYEYIVGKIELWLMKYFDNITSCSDSLSEWMVKYVPVTKNRTVTIYNPIHVGIWYKEVAEYDEYTIFYAGTIAEGKGVGDLIEACALLREHGCMVSLNLAGKMGQYGLKLKNLVANNHYEWCHFLGALPRTELKDLYQKSKVSCFPSRWEAMGIVCIEAMLAGNVVVGSSSGGMAEIISDGVDGLLTPPNDVNVLSNILENALVKSQAEVQCIKDNAFEKIQKNFSIEIILQQIESYYQKIITKHNK